MELGHILVVEDDVRIREMVRNMLQSHGARVAEASTGEEALAALKRNGPFEMVVLDLLIPPPTGLRVMSLVRAAHDDTPFVVITGAADDDLRATVAEMGKAVVLAKPFLMDDLLAVMGRLRADTEAMGSSEEAT